MNQQARSTSLTKGEEMKRWIVAIGACVALTTVSTQASAHGYDAGNAVVGGLVGGVVGGLIGSAVAPPPVYVAPAPVVVERYAPAPVVVQPYAPAPVVVEQYPAPVVVRRHGPPAVVYYPAYR
jgi:hypothetical protein